MKNHPLKNLCPALVLVNKRLIVQYYADGLCITPNYLNELIKKESGLIAKQIINNRLFSFFLKNLD